MTGLLWTNQLIIQWKRLHVTSATSLILKCLSSVSTPLLQEALEVYCHDFFASVKGPCLLFWLKPKKGWVNLQTALKVRRLQWSALDFCALLGLFCVESSKSATKHKRCFTQTSASSTPANWTWSDSGSSRTFAWFLLLFLWPVMWRHLRVNLEGRRQLWREDESFNLQIFT